MNDRTPHEYHALFLPSSIEAPRRDTTMLAIPHMDARIDIECMKGVMSALPYFGCFLEFQSSIVSLGRNFLTNGFLASQFEWLVMVDSDIGFTQEDFLYLLEGTDLAVRAPYARKDDSGEVIGRGLGFARVHRCVLEYIRENYLKNLRFSHNGHSMHDFHLVGIVQEDSGYLGEDSSFWMLVEQVVKVRIETRCKLRHFGRRAYTLGPIDFT